MTLAQIQYHIDRMDVDSILRFIAKQGLRECQGHIYIPRGTKESPALTTAINYLVNEFDYSAGEQPETTRTP